jgi:hypothetical protein
MITKHAPKVIEDAVKKVEDYLQEKEMGENIAAVHVTKENPNGEAQPITKFKYIRSYGYFFHKKI